MRRRHLPGLGLALLALVGCAAPPAERPACPTGAPGAGQAPGILADAATAVVRTNKGEFTMELYRDAAPIATANFVALARCGFYESITFHRVIAGFVIQAGDPQSKANREPFPRLGTGGPGYRFTIETPANELSYDPYVVAMANSGQPDSNGSQFFVNLVDLDDRLPRSYTIFGKVIDGTDVVDAIGALPTNGTPADPSLPGDVPLDPAIIEGIDILPPEPAAT
jgi:cyclophilin family peptidyl-prolyl cis-trans isomerase